MRSQGIPSPRYPRRTATGAGTRGAWLVIVAIIGLLLTPVECAVAMGPHSLFLAADAVASLQSGDPSNVPTRGTHTHSVTGDNDSRDAIDSDRSAPQDHGNLPPNGIPGASASAPDAGRQRSATTASPPRTAGVTSDAIIAFSLPGVDATLEASHAAAPVLPNIHIPPDRFLTGPEPPPP